MKSIARRITVASLLAFVAAGAQSNPVASAEAWRFPGRLLGVYDGGSGRPIQDVEVTDIFNGVTFRTPASGLITLGFLPEGRSLVRIRKIGFTPESMFVSITPRDTTPVTVVLTRMTDLAAVLIKDSTNKYISPNLRAFEERRRMGIGHFVTEGELRKQDGLTLGHALAKVAGLHGTADGKIVSTRGGCSPDIWVDGIKGGAPLTIVTSETRARRDPKAKPPANELWEYPGAAFLEVMEFGAVEYYTPTETPVYLKTFGNGCGVLLLWTRER